MTLDRIIPTGEPIETVNPVADIEIVAGALTVDGKGGGLDRDIDRAPPNISFGVGMLYNPLVLRRAAGFDSGVGRPARHFRRCWRPSRSGLRARRVRWEGGCGGFGRP